MEQLPGHVSLLTHSLARTGPVCQAQAEQEQHLQEQAESPGRKSISGDSSVWQTEIGDETRVRRGIATTSLN